MDIVLELIAKQHLALIALSGVNFHCVELISKANASELWI